MPRATVLPSEAAKQAPGEVAWWCFDNIRPQPFYFDGETVTLCLIHPKAWMWRTEDNYYRLQAKWVGDQGERIPDHPNYSQAIDLVKVRSLRFSGN